GVGTAGVFRDRTMCSFRNTEIKKRTGVFRASRFFVDSFTPSSYLIHFLQGEKIMAQISDGATKNVVLVHGGFVDGSGWEDVYKILKSDGYKVSVVQNPTISLTGDVAATRAVLDAQDGPAVLVGHSYGGVVIT